MADKLNVIFILAGFWRQDHCGCYGATWTRTPHLDQLAQRSTRFTRLYNEALPAEPVRQALLTGRRSAPYNVADGPHPTIAELFRQAGYRTALVTDNPAVATDNPAVTPGSRLAAAPPPPDTGGFDHCERIRGQLGDQWRRPADATPAEIENYTVSAKHFEARREVLSQYIADTRGRRDEADWPAPQVYQAGIKFLRDSAAAQQPFFLVVDHLDPHEPWDPPDPYTDLYDAGYRGRAQRGLIDFPGAADWLTERQLRHLKALYAGEVTLCDAWLGRLLAALEEHGLRERTLIVFLSRGGQALGEHGLVGREPHAMYSELMDLPALYCDPTQPGGGVVTGLLYNIDLPATVLNRVGLVPETLLPGLDVRPVSLDGHGGRPHLTSVCGDYIYVRTKQHVMIAHARGSQFQLYDLRDDPNQSRNIAKDNAEQCRRLFDLAVADSDGRLPRR